MAEHEGGNSWRVPCFCEKKIISAAFYGIQSVTALAFKILTRAGALMKIQVLSVDLDDGGNKPIQNVDEC
jgi:hypothetical protein